MGAGALSLVHVSIRRLGDPIPLIDDLCLTVPPGEVATIMGPSGSGKSTLLALLAGFIDRSCFAWTGQVTLGGEPIDHLPAEARRLGLLFQDAVLFPHLSVGGNLRFGLPRKHAAHEKSRGAIVAAALAEAGLAGFEHRDPSTLSGGQQARVALLRTLLANPRALLLDEPFGRLDAALREEFRAVVFSRAKAMMLPSLLVTHDLADAQAAGGAIIKLKDIERRDRSTG